MLRHRYILNLAKYLLGLEVVNILLLFSTPLLATFWPFFRTTIKALKFHLAGFISSISTSDLWEIEETFTINIAYLQDHACKLYPTKSLYVKQSFYNTRSITWDADNEGCCRIKAYIPSVNAILKHSLSLSVNIYNPIHVIYKVPYTHRILIYDICHTYVTFCFQYWTDSSKFRTANLQQTFNRIYWLTNFTHIYAKITLKCLIFVKDLRLFWMAYTNTHTQLSRVA